MWDVLCHHRTQELPMSGYPNRGKKYEKHLTFEINAENLSNFYFYVIVSERNAYNIS